MQAYFHANRPCFTPSSLDNKIAIVYDGLVQPINPGSTRINVHTKDNKYNAYVNILVSTQ